MIEALLVARAAGHAGDVQVFVHADFGVGEKHLQVGMDAIDDRGEVALFGFALCGAKRAGQEVEDLQFATETVELTCRLFEFVLRMFDGFVNAGAVVDFNAFTQTDNLDSRFDS